MGKDVSGCLFFGTTLRLGTDLGEIAEEKDVVLTDFAGDLDLRKVSVCMPGKYHIAGLTFAPSHVPMIRPPLSTNFMLLVPLASVPAVLMLSLIHI